VSLRVAERASLAREGLGNRLAQLVREEPRVALEDAGAARARQAEAGGHGGTALARRDA
jgi:hypothetical protein